MILNFLQSCNIKTEKMIFDESIVFEPTPNAMEVLSKRYLLHHPETGKIIETIPMMFTRIARCVAQARFDINPNIQDKDKYMVEYYEMLARNEFVPNSPTFTGAGTQLGQLAACFVLPVADEMGKTEDGIFSTLRHGALIQQTGGGNGFSFSRLREKNSPVLSSGGKSSGPISFMKVFDIGFGAVAQGGTRRGANMAVLEVDHPDIKEFIQCKSVEGSITNFNISVNISDKFMNAVKNDETFDLVSRFNGEVKETIRARDLFDMIAKYAHHNGEPGVLFGDSANRDNPVPHMYKLEATNPCGEQWLGPYENCCLGSINLDRMYDPETNNVDWNKLEKVTCLATRFLDDVLDANKYVPSIPRLKEAALDTRRIGLGILGLSDLLYKLGIGYGSEEGIAFGSYIMEFIHYMSMTQSVLLAIEYGPFRKLHGSMFDLKNPYIKNRWTPPVPLMPYPEHFESKYKRPVLYWNRLENEIKVHGIRNSTNTTIAPTGTISTISGVEGYGCEPTFALSYIRHFNDHGNDKQLCYVSPSFQKALDGCELLTNEQRSNILTHVLQKGTCQDIPYLPEDIKKVFVVSKDITPEQHVRTQAALQRFVSNSISKTCNLPKHATIDDVKKIFTLAWESGCKGLTIYVEGSRDKVVLETKEVHDSKKEEQKSDINNDNLRVSVNDNGNVRKERPRMLNSTTMNLNTPMGTLNTTVAFHHGSPFETFFTIGKNSSDGQGWLEAVGRLTSLILQLEDNVSVETRIKEVIRQLEGIGGSRKSGLGLNQISSGPDAIARSLIEILMTKYPDQYNRFVHEESISAMKIKKLKSLSESVEQINIDTISNNKIDIISPSNDDLNYNKISSTSSLSSPDIYCPQCQNNSIIIKGGCKKCTTCTFKEC